MNETMRQLAKFLERYQLSLNSHGATRQAVDALEVACGSAFSLSYRGFLGECGTNPGSLRLSGDAWTTVEALMEHYSDPAEMAHTPKGAIVISTSGLCDSQMISYDGTPEGGPVRTFGCPRPCAISASFRHHLFQCGWVDATVYRKGTSVLRAIWTTAEVPAIACQLEAIGFRELWFSDAFGNYSEREDAWAWVRASPGETSLSVRARAPETERRILDALIASTGPPRAYFYAD